MSNGIKQDTIDITTSLDDNVQPDIYLDPRRSTEINYYKASVLKVLLKN